MNLITKIFLATLIFNLPNVTFAEAAEILAEQKNISAETKKQEVSTAPAVKEFSAEGEYRLGDRDTRETAKTAALADAKRKIIEQVGVYVQSYSEMNKFNLTQDQIKTAAEAMIKIKHEEVHFYEDGTICRAFVVASVNMKNIPAPAPIPKPDPTPDKKLKLLGIEEFNGHYYKVFNDGMNWKDAKKACEDMGGHLVTITSIIEQEVVKNLIVANGTKNFYWTGGFTANGTDWQWITGEKFSYSNWCSVAPNGFDSGKLVENIIMLYRNQKENLDGLWDDVNELGNNGGQWHYYDMENSGFVCEWESYDDIKI